MHDPAVRGLDRERWAPREVRTTLSPVKRSSPPGQGVDRERWCRASVHDVVGREVLPSLAMRATLKQPKDLMELIAWALPGRGVGARFIAGLIALNGGATRGCTRSAVK